MSDSHAESERALVSAFPPHLRLANPYAKRATLDKLEYLRIEPSRLSDIDQKSSVSGGFGNVRRALLDSGTAKELIVAVKELHPPGNDQDRLRQAIRLARELRVWAGLLHPNILPLVGYHLSDDMTIARLISPFESNGQLFDYFRRASPNEAERLQLAIDTANGLAYLHNREHPIVHGDLKHHNVLVGLDRRAVLCDFGLAKMEDASVGLTTSTGFQGTIRYFSPELVDPGSGEPVRSMPSDVWAWACLLLEILKGIIPFSSSGYNEGQLLYTISQGARPVDLDKTDLAEPLKDLAKRCWSTDPSARPPILECLDLLTSFYVALTDQAPIVREEVATIEDAMCKQQPQLRILVQNPSIIRTTKQQPPALVKDDEATPRVELKPLVPGYGALAAGNRQHPIPSGSKMTAAQRLYAGLGHLPKLEQTFSAPAVSGPLSGSPTPTGPKLRHAVSAQALQPSGSSSTGVIPSQIERVTSSVSPSASSIPIAEQVYFGTSVKPTHHELEQGAMQREQALERSERMETAGSQAYDSRYGLDMLSRVQNSRIPPRTARSAPVRQRSISLGSQRPSRPQNTTPQQVHAVHPSFLGGVVSRGRAVTQQPGQRGLSDPVAEMLSPPASAKSERSSSSGPYGLPRTFSPQPIPQSPTQPPDWARPLSNLSSGMRSGVNLTDSGPIPRMLVPKEPAQYPPIMTVTRLTGGDTGR